MIEYYFVIDTTIRIIIISYNNDNNNNIASGFCLPGFCSREIYDTSFLAQFAISLISVILFHSVSIDFLTAFKVGVSLL